MNENKNEFATDIAMGWVIYSYGWRMAVAIVLLSLVNHAFLYPNLPVLAILLEIVGVLVILIDGIRRILRSRGKLKFVGDSLSVNAYCGTSFRIDGLTQNDFILVQNPRERWTNTGRLLIRNHDIYMRGVRNVKQLMAYINGVLAEKKS